MEEQVVKSSVAEKHEEVEKPQTTPVENKKNTRMGFIALGVVIALLLIGAIFQFGMTKKDAETPKVTMKPVKIAAMLPYSGGGAGAGLGELKGIQLAKKKLGASNVEIIQADSKCDAKTAEQVVKDVIAQGVVAIIGEACSSASLAALPEANKNKVVMISATASSPQLSVPDDYFFRVIPPDGFQGKFTAQLLTDRGIKNVSVLYIDDAYGKALSKIFQDNFTALGGKIVSSDEMKYDSIALQTHVAHVKAAKPDAIYLIASSAPTTVAALKLLKAAGVTAPIYGSDAVYDTLIVKDSQGAAEGLIVNGFSNGTQAFKQALENEYPSEELFYGAPQAYDAFHALYLALQTGASTGEEIKNALANVEFEGVSGNIKFDANGEISDNYKYGVFQVKNGVFVPVDY